LKKGHQLVICPKCSEAFPIDDIVTHVLTHTKDQAKLVDQKPSGA
jgi:hypothetical protein